MPEPERQAGSSPEERAAALHAVARALRATKHLGREAKQSLADFLDALEDPETTAGTPPADVKRLTERATALLNALQHQRDAGVRLGSIDILGKQPEDNAVREALVYALRYDRNPGVRLKALDGLKGYVKDDVHVRDAVLEALIHDTNAGVRAEAIALLDPVKADMTARDTLRVLAERDQNKFIRNESRRYLASTPNLD